MQKSRLLKHHSYLARSVSCVPQSITKVFSRTSGGIHNFDGETRVALSFGWCGVPVRLGDLLPHDNIETTARLVAKYKACIIIIPFCIDEEGATEVHSIEFIKTYGGIKEESFRHRSSAVLKQLLNSFWSSPSP